MKGAMWRLLALAVALALACVVLMLAPHGAPPPRPRRACARRAVATRSSGSTDADATFEARVAALEARTEFAAANDLAKLRADVDALRPSLAHVRDTADLMHRTMTGTDATGRALTALGAYFDVASKADAAHAATFAPGGSVRELEERVLSVERGLTGGLIGIAFRFDLSDSPVLLAEGTCNNIEDYSVPRNQGFTHIVLMRGYELKAFADPDCKGQDVTIHHPGSSSKTFKTFKVELSNNKVRSFIARWKG